MTPRAIDWEKGRAMLAAGARRRAVADALGVLIAHLAVRATKDAEQGRPWPEERVPCADCGYELRNPHANRDRCADCQWIRRWADKVAPDNGRLRRVRDALAAQRALGAAGPLQQAQERQEAARRDARTAHTRERDHERVRHRPDAAVLRALGVLVKHPVARPDEKAREVTIRCWRCPRTWRAMQGCLAWAHCDCGASPIAPTRTGYGDELMLRRRA